MAGLSGITSFGGITKFKPNNNAALVTFSISLIGGLGGNLAGEPQGLGYDATNDVVYTMSNNSGARQVKKVNSSGTTLETSSNQNGQSNNIQDGCVYNGKVYVPRGSGTYNLDNQTGYVQRFDLDLNYETEITLPMARYTTAMDFAHGSWWMSCYEDKIYQVSEDFTTVEAIHDISAGNKPATFRAWGGLAWYGNYLWGTEHQSGSEIDIWYWNGAQLVLHQELSTSGLDLYNGLAIDATNDILYASSRTLADDIQKYNITTS